MIKEKEYNDDIIYSIINVKKYKFIIVICIINKLMLKN